MPYTSTISAILNSVSGILYTDYICHLGWFEPTERRANAIMKAVIVLIGALCIALGFVVEKSTSLFQVMFTVSSLTNGAVFGVFTLALFYPWSSQKVCVRSGWRWIGYIICFDLFRVCFVEPLLVFC